MNQMILTYFADRESKEEKSRGGHHQPCAESRG